MGLKVGIDLGTTFSAVAMMDEGSGQPVIIPNTAGERITPSFIQFTDDGEIIVGQEAKEAFEAGETGCASVFKRNMGRGGVYCSYYGKDYTAEELSAILLRHLKEEAESVTGEEIEEAVVTVPAYFYHKERQATMEAAKLAGLNVRQIINEPTAAAMNYGANHWRENARVLVYDLGGGTFDVTVVQMKGDNRMDSLQTLGDHTLGGKDWDTRLCSLIKDKIGEDTGMAVLDNPEIHKAVMQIMESIKKQLTKLTSVNVKCYIPGYGSYNTSVTRDEFEQATGDLLEKTGVMCSQLLAGLNAGWSDITDILLVGGSTRMRQVSDYLKKISGHTPLNQVHPDEAVALGAAIQVYLPKPAYTVLAAAPSSGRKEDGEKIVSETVGKEAPLPNALCIRHMDVVAHAMGIIAVNKEGTEYINKTIVPANQQIPVKCAQAFHYQTSARGDNEVEIYVLQGDRRPLECEIIGKYIVSGITHNRDKNPAIIRIQYSYDMNGMIHVQARQEDSEQDLPIRKESVPEDMSKYGRPVEAEVSNYTEPLSVVMAVDVSGSMDGKPMGDALHAMCHFVDMLEDYPGDVEIGVIAVSDRSEVVQTLTEDMYRCKQSIQYIKCGQTGYSNEGHPFEDIGDMLRYREGRGFAIVLADGMWMNQREAVLAAKKCHAAGIDITGIGFGMADKEFLDNISSGDINAMLVSQSELSSSFGKIAQEIGESSGHSLKKGKDGETTSAFTWLATGED